MEIHDTRRARLALLIRERYEGSQARFVDVTGENQGEVSALLKAKSFGERKARKLETKCGLPAGWFDIEDDEKALIALRPEGRQTSGAQLRSVDRPEALTSTATNYERMALVYVTPKEIELLTNYRRASEIGKSLVETAAESAGDGSSATGSANQS